MEVEKEKPGLYLCCFLIASALGQAGGRLRQDTPGKEDKQSWCTGQRKRQPPSPRLNVLRSIVDETSNQNSNSDKELEDDVECASQLCRSHFCEVQRANLQQTYIQNVQNLTSS